MRQLIYSSVETPDLGEGGVFEIIKTSVRKNTDSDVCGFLIYLNGAFLQLLEGPEDSVSEVFERICEDPRHTDLKVLLDQPVPHQHFERWAMRRIPLSSANDLFGALGELEKPVRQAGLTQVIEKFVRTSSAKAA